MRPLFKKTALLAFVCAAMCLTVGCSEPPPKPVQLKAFSLDTADAIIDSDMVRIDSDPACKGGACLRVETSGPKKVRLFMLDDINVEDASLIFQAKVRSKDLTGTAYLEMWCTFQGKGEFFSRALDTAVTGDTEWVIQTAPFQLEKGQKPDQILLNLIIEGPGTVWIDDAALYRGPLM